MPSAEVMERAPLSTGDSVNSRSRDPDEGHDAGGAKLKSIHDACEAGNFERLVSLATAEHGLIEDQVRRKAWPILLGADPQRDRDGEKLGDWRILPRHRDEDQVRLDVDRSFIYYPNDLSPEELSRRKEQLSELITQVLRQNAYLSYFQGYHDICQVFLLVLGPEASVSAVERISVLRIRDYMLPSLSPALSHLQLLPSILNAEDPKLCAHLSQTQPFFALAATLTLYAHDIQEYGDIARLFDVLLAREAIFSVYLFAQIVLQRREELFEIPPTEPEMLHSILCKLPKPLDLETLITRTSELVNKHPPKSLRGWRHLSSNSVLKTAQSSEQASEQSLTEGAALFQKQANELRRAELRQIAFDALWKYRGPVRNVGFAVVVAALGFWIRRNPNSLLIFRSGGLFDYFFQGFKRLYDGGR
ncbi:MAG: hypothetical protein M4579_001703 [Chaenotheca gracillima]|nr:MAG: hypothetical protein M4579_001703 [Chaenotheca gracillima]